MTISTEIRRVLGTMIVYGYPKAPVEGDLAIAAKLGATVVEVLPDWGSYPDAILLKSLTRDRGLRIHSAHGCWGGQSIHAQRVDLGSTDSRIWTESVDDLKRCVDWLAEAGGTCLVVHPGGLSEQNESERRREALLAGLARLANYAWGTEISICVENMPPGVHPGTRMVDLASIVDELGRGKVFLALDTGHAEIAASARSETMAAGDRLRTTHVHDNDGRQDSHLPPGSGGIDWAGWVEALDAVDYRGPIVLECIRHLRDHPDLITSEFLERLRRICRMNRS